MGFMACSRRLNQTGMYLKNEYSVFKGHPDFRPYKVSLTRILRFRVGLVGALWLSLQGYLRFVLTFLVSYAVGLGQKKYPVGFPTRHRRRFYSVFCKLVPVYLLVTIWVTANVSKKAKLISANQTSCILLWGYLLFCDTLLWLSPRAVGYWNTASQNHTTSHHASEDLFYKIRLVFFQNA